jgi:hypothetical protein
MMYQGLPDAFPPNFGRIFKKSFVWAPLARAGGPNHRILQSLLLAHPKAFIILAEAVGSVHSLTTLLNDPTTTQPVFWHKYFFLTTGMQSHKQSSCITNSIDNKNASKECILTK